MTSILDEEIKNLNSIGESSSSSSSSSLTIKSSIIINETLSNIFNSIEIKLLNDRKQHIINSIAHAYIIGWCYSYLSPHDSQIQVIKLLSSESENR
jgi:hypothetical protein